jgi:hypothetical protein
MRKLILLALAIFWLWATSGPSQADPENAPQAALE